MKKLSTTAKVFKKPWLILLFLLCAKVSAGQSYWQDDFYGRDRNTFYVKVNGIIVKIGSDEPKIIMPPSRPYNTSYWNNFWTYKAGKIKSIGSLQFDYYNDFWAYQAGKLSNFGNIKITYFNDFWSYNAGKIASIGNVKFTYHSDFWIYKAGKVASIGNVKFDYQDPSLYDNSRPSVHIQGSDDSVEFLD